MQAHRVSLADYHEQLMVNYDSERLAWLNRCVFICRICDAEFQFRSDFTQAAALNI